MVHFGVVGGMIRAECVTNKKGVVTVVSRRVVPPSDP